MIRAPIAPGPAICNVKKSSTWMGVSRWQGAQRTEINKTNDCYEERKEMNTKHKTGRPSK